MTFTHKCWHYKAKTLVWLHIKMYLL